MPELPEVESIAYRLREGTLEQAPLVGAEILSAQVFWQRTLATPSPEKFSEALAGQVIQAIGRRGKFLRIDLTDYVLLIHLRMSGDLWVEAMDAPLAKHTRIILNFSDHRRLNFHDPRKFGRVWLVTDPQQVLSSLGPEPFDSNLTSEVFYQHLQQVRRQLKPLLLDQRFLAGLGNIYADEALHCAGLHPLTLSHQLTLPEARRLLECIRTVLREGIRRNGASIDWVYRGGDFQNYFRVYQRVGLPCPTCGTAIQRIKVGQRGTHFCPNCQPLR
ncbi:MAG: DNA-formamidopyrimidine glycosylase [Anaerolineae bacterium]|jgi:formamidopyrimidine-DNA glycosylase|nr:MAG: DNA-formamidopyrimidine glycosylase [Anaerolineae bacterium]